MSKTPVKVLVVRKPDATVHKVPLANKAGLMALNKRLPAAQKWTLEEMDEEEANKLDFIDKNFVTGAEASEQNKELQEKLSEKDQMIADLQAQLAKKNEKAPAAVDQIAKIGEAKTVEEVNEILGTDIRATVKDAAAAKILELTNPPA